MKRVLTVLITVLMFASFSIAGEPYDVFWLTSPEPSLPDSAVRGVNNDFEFSAIIWDEHGPNQSSYTDTVMKGVFGKLDDHPLRRGEFIFTQAYNPPESDINSDWTMGFMGMSESGLVTSLAWKKYQGITTMPEFSAVLKWTHMFNSMGYSTFDDIHELGAVLPSTLGDSDWIGGMITDINTAGRTVGWEIGGDAFSFDTNGAVFDYRWRSTDTNNFNGPVRLWGINDNNYAVGIGIKAGTSYPQIFIIQVTSSAITWLTDIDSDIQPTGDMIAGNVAISGISEIAYIGQLTGESPGIVIYNYNTQQKTQKVSWADNVDFSGYTNFRLMDMSTSQDPIFVGNAKNIATGRYQGFIAYPR